MAKRQPFVVQMAGFAVPVRWEPLADSQGEWRPDPGEIVLDDALTDGQAEEVLMHECIHAAAGLHGWNLPETKVRPFSLTLHQMLAGAIDARRLWRKRKR